MIIKTNQNIPVIGSEKEEVYPLMALRSGVLFPGTNLSIQVVREENMALINFCHSKSQNFVAAFSPAVKSKAKSGNISVHQIGVLAKICDVRQGPGEYKTITIEGFERVVLKEIKETQEFKTVSIDRLKISSQVPVSVKKQAREALQLSKKITELDPSYSSEQLLILSASLGDPSMMADEIAFSFRLPLESKQQLLEIIDLDERFTTLNSLLTDELERVEFRQSLGKKAAKKVRRKREVEFLKEELVEIKRLLGDQFIEEKEAERFKELVKALPHLPNEVVSKAIIEADRLSQLSTASAEYGVTKNYLEWLLSLPWGKCSPESYDIADVERILSRDYYGPTNIKEQILERLSVRKLLGGQSEGPTLCLVGAHGTGKASLAKAVATAMGKEFIRISVGGISDVSEIKGSPRTFLGALPGKIIRTLRNAGSCDPVILIEDIDYFNIDNDSSVNMALLEAIDTRYNFRFFDQYLGVPFDLSKVYFICSVRSFEEIPEQFIPRLEILELPGYIAKEKITISKRYIIPRLLEKHGIQKSELKFSDKILALIISDYTMEAGLLGFSQQIEKICRKIALRKAEKKKVSVSVNDKNLESYLGLAQYIPEKAVSQPEIGTATGLAWTGAGGELMFIEGLKMKGNGEIITTGSLGEVMRESILAAHSYVRSKADVLAIDHNDFSDLDIHIHFPSGAIPKDGPSAGVAVCMVVASVMAERPIRNDIAMTGEVTLRGKILPVGGIKEKISAAFRAGIHEIALPKENEKDLRELPKEIIRKTKFIFIERVDELFEKCLLDYSPSSYTLEKIFTEEIAKSKKKKRRTTKGRKRAAKSASKK